MKELDQMISLGLASIDTSERVILALTLLTNLVHQRDRLYRFLMACAGPAYIQNAIYWKIFCGENKG